MTSTTLGSATVPSNWTARFRTPHLMTVRPTMGAPDTALVIENRAHGPVGRIWRSRPAPGEDEWSADLTAPVGFDALLSEDAQWVATLEDDGGSEVGALVAHAVAGDERRNLTPPGRSYVVRGMEFSADGRTFLTTAVDDDGFHLVIAPLDRSGEPRIIWSSANESWYGHISADGRYASVDTTDHNPAVRRPAVSVVDVAGGDVVDVANDLPAGPIRGVRWSSIPGDQRLLISTERSGFARPAIWSPLSGERVDFDLPEYTGDLLPLDWSTATARILLAHVEDGIHRLVVLDADTGTTEVVREGTGSYADPDVAAELAYYSQSYLGGDGRVLAFEQSWDRPPSLVEIGLEGTVRTAIAAPEVPAGVPFRSEMIPGAEGRSVQLWWALPRGDVRGTVLLLHGGPNLVTTDHYSPGAQAWLAEGYACAALNYHGSVTFGREFREGFWQGYGDREVADVRAAVLRLRELGVADPASTFVTGPSYGGHLTLLAMGRLPDMFAGGFAVVAMADWASAFADMNPALRIVWEKVLANGDLSFEAACEKLSGITYVDSVSGSVWLCQGARDTRTPPAQAQNYADRLRERGGDVLIEWFDAGHSPDDLAAEEAWQRRMLELAELTRSGIRWSDGT
ncbi:prolyl oligopeptidase family serine peptidase [Microbacterium sp. NPDC058342]|uniref:S9 family peptidase n=1 Tax=Microbacterium sp. NPDC058342 TaxID=3346454 RepID=UPI0036676F7C